MKLVLNNYFALLPFFASFFQIVLIVASYIVGRVCNDSINAMPYPSDLGVSFPERGLFELSLSIGSTLAFSVVLLRFIQGLSSVADAYSRRRLNQAAFFFGSLMVLGQMIVAVFPDVEGLRRKHFIGACMFFLSAMIYMLLQTIYSRLVYAHSKCLVRVRLLCCVLSFGSTIAYIFGRLYAPKEKNRYHIPQVSEWIGGFSINLFIFTFCSDFYDIDVVNQDLVMSPLN